MALFQSSRNAPPRFGCFGKLPSYADFMSLNVDGPETQSLAAWMQEGIGASPRAASHDREQFVHYAWRPEAGRRTLVGVMWQSADAAGRHFPFTIFTSFPQQQITGHGVRAFLAAAGVRSRIHELYQSLSRSPRIRDQYVMINDAPVPAVPEHSDVWRAWSERSEAPTLRREDAAAVAGHVVSLARFAERALRAPELPDFALRVQLLGPDADVEVATWSQLLCDRLGAPDIDASYFLRFSRGGPSAFLFHRELSAADLGFLLAPSDEYRAAESISLHANGAGGARTRLADVIARTWTQRPPSYRSILDLVANAPADEMAETSPQPAQTRSPPPTKSQALSSSQVTPLPPAPPAPREREKVTGPVVLDAPAASPAPPQPASAAPSAAPVVPAPAPPDASASPADAATPEPATPSSPATEPPPPATSAPPSVPPSAPTPPSQAETVATLEPTETELEARITALAAGALLPGRLVRASPAMSASAVETAETESEGVRGVLLYMEDAGYAALLGALEAPDVARVEQQIAACTEARALLREIARRHRATEERLAKAVDEACARAPRPGKSS